MRFWKTPLPPFFFQNSNIFPFFLFEDVPKSGSNAKTVFHKEGDRIINSDLPASGSSSSLLESSSSFLEQSTSSTSALEQSLEEAEGRIAGLLSVKDRLVTVQVSFHMWIEDHLSFLGKAMRITKSYLGCKVAMGEVKDEALSTLLLSLTKFLA